MIRLRLARPTDARALSELTFPFTGVRVKPSKVAARLRSSGEIVALAVADGQLAGFACAEVASSICYEYPWAELSELYVRPEFRREGVGRKLVGLVERELRRQSVNHIHILTMVRNHGARRLYEELGYRVNTRRPEVLYEKDMRPRAGGRRARSSERGSV